MTLAFLAPAFAAAADLVDRTVTPKPEPEVEALRKERELVAQFNPNQLDARPVIWSLYHHPEEWARHPGDDNWLCHVQYGHYANTELGIVSGYECSCHRREFQQSQRGELRAAGVAFRSGGHVGGVADYPKPIVRGGYEADQFAGHFIR